MSAWQPVATETPTSWAITGALPAGLSFNTTTGIITGTPTTPSRSWHLITATNGSGTSEAVTLHLSVVTDGSGATYTIHRKSGKTRTINNVIGSYVKMVSLVNRTYRDEYLPCTAGNLDLVQGEALARYPLVKDDVPTSLTLNNNPDSISHIAPRDYNFKMATLHFVTANNHVGLGSFYFLEELEGVTVDG